MLSNVSARRYACVILICSWYPNTFRNGNVVSYIISVRVDKSIVFGGQRIRIEVYRSQSYGQATLCFFKDPLDEIETQRQWQRDRATKSWYYIFFIEEYGLSTELRLNTAIFLSILDWKYSCEYS